jgi:hypothetical protein
MERYHLDSTEWNSSDLRGACVPAGKAGALDLIPSSGDVGVSTFLQNTPRGSRRVTSSQSSHIPQPYLLSLPLPSTHPTYPPNTLQHEHRQSRKSLGQSQGGRLHGVHPSSSHVQGESTTSWPVRGHPLKMLIRPRTVPAERQSVDPTSCRAFPFLENRKKQPRSSPTSLVSKRPRPSSIPRALLIVQPTLPSLIPP